MNSDTEAQYGLGKILLIWAAVSIPMPILAFGVAPAMAEIGSVEWILLVWYLLIGGMVWQFVLSVILLSQELEQFTWTAVKERIWLKAPRDPKTGVANYWLFLWLIPMFVLYVALEVSPIGVFIGELILIPFPALANLPLLDLSILAVPELEGAWWLVGVALISCLFNYLLGEELLFRGVLLPKMNGVFGDWDWVANSVLFALYHLHRPTQMLGFILGTMAWVWPAKRFRSIWFPIILHGFEGTFVIIGAISVAAGVGL
ncbi:CPBP family intramembrane glutamic endopeptidase [Tropicimonas marinistellae]|uniref:CPBP family intramembrane glutamic endopeptidase n=1 Tax=Tropicimonas marinistellae TaxID=1739787 RepID=UPI00082D409A|nr:CPBP family intramembrane glutamic endopeptidase [Tropicimonas marinistellae]